MDVWRDFFFRDVARESNLETGACLVPRPLAHVWEPEKHPGSQQLEATSYLSASMLWESFSYFDQSLSGRAFKLSAVFSWLSFKESRRGCPQNDGPCWLPLRRDP